MYDSNVANNLSIVWMFLVNRQAYCGDNCNLLHVHSHIHGVAAAAIHLMPRSRPVTAGRPWQTWVRWLPCR